MWGVHDGRIRSQSSDTEGHVKVMLYTMLTAQATLDTRLTREDTRRSVTHGRKEKTECHEEL